MKKSAIQFALYLYMHPQAGLDQWYLMRALPQGMSDLLHATASMKKRAEIADLLEMEQESLREAFIKFLQLVLSDHQKSPYRGLAAREQASLDTCIRNKKLLQNIFHPDKFQGAKSSEIILQIQQSFEKIQHLNFSPQNTETQADSRPRFNNDGDMGFQVNNTPHAHSARRRHQQKKQTNYVLTAGIAGLALAGLLVVLIVPSNPHEMVRQTVVTPTSITEPTEKLVLAGSTSTSSKSSLFNSPYQAVSQASNTRIQVLLNEFERALEADLITQLLATKTPSQSSKQIIKLFTSAHQKKVFFHNFSWSTIENGFYGEGEFLARFEFNKQWVTRKGKSSITLANNNSKLLIKQFHFEDNLH